MFSMQSYSRSVNFVEARRVAAGLMTTPQLERAKARAEQEHRDLLERENDVCAQLTERTYALLAEYDPLVRASRTPDEVLAEYKRKLDAVDAEFEPDLKRYEAAMERKQEDIADLTEQLRSTAMDIFYRTTWYQTMSSIWTSQCLAQAMVDLLEAADEYGLTRFWFVQEACDGVHKFELHPKTASDSELYFDEHTLDTYLGKEALDNGKVFANAEGDDRCMHKFVELHLDASVRKKQKKRRTQ